MAPEPRNTRIQLHQHNTPPLARVDQLDAREALALFFFWLSVLALTVLAAVGR